MTRFSYPMLLNPDSVDGGFVVTFPDLPEAITQGDTIQDCLEEAQDCLEEAIAARMSYQLEIPVSNLPQNAQYIVHLPLRMTLLASIYLAMQETGINTAQLANYLQVPEKEIKQILSPTQETSLSTLEKVIYFLGKQVEIDLISC